MKDRMERFVLLPFAAGCVSEASIPVGMQHAKRSKPDTHSIPTSPFLFRNTLKHRGTDEGIKVEEDDEHLDNDEGRLSGENLKTAITRFQKLFNNFKNLSQLFVYKNELEPEMGIEIGFPTDVKHVTHIGLDDCGSSIFTKDWNNLGEPELINLNSFHPTALELALATQDETPDLMSVFETKCRNYH
ncbi:hypothetical protein BUALT_Bualt15G0101300 [Buddleja alternifolia]|uniref:CRIB domain-containing protein n=1 Tax=Buddleja alternifolia TaxID=168488 RepID=A0AAV6WKM6_9LAMI|nr:hypothetical protein BUALT_Bualt15G0101300 [Buddleja alternifolia]